MRVDPKPADNLLKARRNLSGVYFFTLCFYAYYFFASHFYTYNFFDLLKSVTWVARRRKPIAVNGKARDRKQTARGTGMTSTIGWGSTAPV
jgi:hypothetical protein